MEFDRVITEKYSVRKFKDERLTQSDIDNILSAGHKAPTGCNYQPKRRTSFNRRNPSNSKNKRG